MDNPDANRAAIKTTAENAIDPNAEDAYWRANHSAQPYIQADRGYEYYHPAYRYGWETRTQRPTGKWEEVESELERGWDRFKGESRLTWHEAKAAARGAWNRIDKGASRDARR